MVGRILLSWGGWEGRLVNFQLLGGSPPPILSVGKTLHIKIGVAKKGMNAAQKENLINSKFIVVLSLNIWEWSYITLQHYRAAQVLSEGQKVILEGVRKWCWTKFSLIQNLQGMWKISRDFSGKISFFVFLMKSIYNKFWPHWSFQTQKHLFGT